MGFLHSESSILRLIAAEVKFNVFLFFAIGLVLCAIFAKISSQSETYDFLVYYYFYGEIQSIGLPEFISSLIGGGGKFEPLLYFVYYLFPSGLTGFAFAFLNLLLIVLLLSVLNMSINVCLRINSNGLYLLALYFAWYPGYMSTLWVWRNVIAVIFFTMAMVCFFSEKRFKFYLFVLFSFLTHYLVVIFMPLFLFLKVRVFDYYEGRVLFVLSSLLLGMLIGCFSAIYFGAFSFFISGSPDLASDTETGFLVFLYVFVLILILVSHAVIRRFQDFYMKILAFLLFISGISFNFANSHLIINRFTLLIIAIFALIYPVFRKRSGGSMRFVVDFYIFLGCIPTLISVVRYLG